MLILSIQVSPSFFSGYFPQMESVRFGTEIFHRAASPRHQTIYREILETTRDYCRKSPFYELDCARSLNALFRHLLGSIGIHHCIRGGPSGPAHPAGTGTVSGGTD